MKRLNKADASMAMDIELAKKFMSCGSVGTSILALANQLQALIQLRQYCGRLMEGYDAGLVLAVFQEKAALVPDLQTQKDTQDFWKESLPIYIFGKFVPQSRFHSNAEELLCWKCLSSLRRLKHDEYIRMESLFVRYFGHEFLDGLR